MSHEFLTAKFNANGSDRLLLSFTFPCISNEKQKTKVGSSFSNTLNIIVSCSTMISFWSMWSTCFKLRSWFCYWGRRYHSFYYRERLWAGYILSSTYANQYYRMFRKNKMKPNSGKIHLFLSGYGNQRIEIGNFTI